MKPYLHAKISAKKFGGVAEDYLEIHDFIDSSKQCLADVRHRAILHSSFGIFICEKVFGTYVVNSNGDQVQVRDVAEEHVKEDLGFIPSVEHWVKNMRIEEWMGGRKKHHRTKTINHKFDND